jgi:hypothetical protein
MLPIVWYWKVPIYTPLHPQHFQQFFPHIKTCTISLEKQNCHYLASAMFLIISHGPRNRAVLNIVIVYPRCGIYIASIDRQGLISLELRVHLLVLQSLSALLYIYALNVFPHKLCRIIVVKIPITARGTKHNRVVILELKVQYQYPNASMTSKDKTLPLGYYIIFFGLAISWLL